jgi:PIN domain nuclease of toxin-antitoxin system
MTDRAERTSTQRLWALEVAARLELPVVTADRAWVDLGLDVAII